MDKKDKKNYNDLVRKLKLLFDLEDIKRKNRTHFYYIETLKSNQYNLSGSYDNKD